MRDSTEPKSRKYIEGYTFLSFARKFGDKQGKNLINTATKTEVDAAKTASKRVVQKTAEAIGSLIRNKIADKLVQWVNQKVKKKKMKKIKDKKSTYHQKKDRKLLII